MSRKTVRDTLSQDEYQKAMAYKRMEDIIDAVPRNEKGRPSVPGRLFGRRQFQSFLPVQQRF